MNSGSNGGNDQSVVLRLEDAVNWVGRADALICGIRSDDQNSRKHSEDLLRSLCLIVDRFTSTASADLPDANPGRT